MCRLQGILSILSFWWVTGCLSESGQNKDCGEEIHAWKQFVLAELLFGNTEAYFHLIIYIKEKHSLHWIQLRNRHPFLFFFYNLNPLQTWLTAHESKRGLYGFMMTLIIALTHSSAANLLTENTDGLSLWLEVVSGCGVPAAWQPVTNHIYYLGQMVVHNYVTVFCFWWLSLDLTELLP